jgi:glutaredoxin
MTIKQHRRIIIPLLTILGIFFFTNLPAVFASNGINSQEYVDYGGVNQVTTPAPDEHFCGKDCLEETDIQADNDQISYEPGRVKAILFWMEGCPHCAQVKATTIPMLEKQYGNQLEIKQIELKTPYEIDTLLRIGIQHGYSANQIGVPFMVIGDDVLVGSSQIPVLLPDLITSYLNQGGVGYPNIEELADYLPAPATSTPVSSPVSSPETIATLKPTATTTPVQIKSPVNTTVYFFWGDGCPHCAEAKPFLENLESQYPTVEVKRYEVWGNLENQKVFQKIAGLYGLTPHAVPTIFIGEQHWEGFNDAVRAQIEFVIENCVIEGCPDRGENLLSLKPVIATPSFTSTPVQSEQPATKAKIAVPLIGVIDLSSHSLLFSTLMIAFVDGFNPCSIWVLSMLLSITLHTGSRKKVLVIGLVFLIVTAIIYAMFIAGLFTIFAIVNYVGWIQILVALVALFFALVNIKDYFWYKEGISLTIDDKKKPGIYKQIRQIMNAGDSIWGLIGGTIILAAGVSLVEFACTSGFPVIWTNLLSAQQVTATTFIILLCVYMLIYQLDELAIFLAAVFTFRSRKIEEKHGRILKLIGGILMLTLAIVMLINPGYMNDLSQSMIIFGIAFSVTGLILLIHRVILPRMGIQIGSETESNIDQT